MKTWLIFSVPLLLGTLFACSKANDTSNDPPVIIKTAHGADTVLISFYDTVQIPGQNKYLTLDTLYDDSRCPVNVMCIWAGAFTVGLNLISAGNDQRIKMGTYPGQVADTVMQGTEIKVLDLLPYPDTRITVRRADRKVKVGLFW